MPISTGTWLAGALHSIHALQLLQVITSDQQTVEGELCCFERNSLKDAWKSTGNPIEVTVGAQGSCPAAVKREGDGKTPLGNFPLHAVFGYENLSSQIQMPYLHLQEGLLWIDDPHSRHYNQMVDVRIASEPDWKSFEVMRREDSLYKLGIVVGYNMDPIVPGLGSAIFMHIWSGKGRGTAGCIAMSERDLERIICWLDVQKLPQLIVCAESDREHTAQPS